MGAITDDLAFFVLAGVLLNLTPGPDVLFVVTQSLLRGWRSGAMAACGIAAGCFVHIIAAAWGLSVLLAASDTAFFVLKWAGAAYLAWMGLVLLGMGGRRVTLRPAEGLSVAMHSIAACARDERAGARIVLQKIFVQGFWTNALNPKVALFFLAFVPQFVAPGAQNNALAFFWLGLIFNVNGLWVNLAYAGLAAAISRQFCAVQRGMRWLERGAGVLFIAFGLKLALTDSHST